MIQLKHRIKNGLGNENWDEKEKLKEKWGKNYCQKLIFSHK
jgi:hypothetical protein